MKEKQKIELGTAEGFLCLYNKYSGTSFQISKHGDAPDIRCMDDSGRELNIEVTATEDQPATENDPGDIQAILGRSDHRTVEALADRNKRRSASKELLPCSSFDDVVETLVRRISKKLSNDYGKNTALVVRDTSGCDWEWDEVAEDIASKIHLSRNPFDEGIWLLTRTKDKLFEIIGPQNETAR